MLKAEALPGFVCIHVIDPAPGIPADEIDLVTRKFVRGRAPRRRDGTRPDDRQPHCTGPWRSLQITSVVGEGTSVRVTLPAAQSAELMTAV